MRSRFLLLFLLLPLGGCATAIVPPPPPVEPRNVFLLDHGRHSSLVIEAVDGVLWRYSYGDWAYYAERQTSVGDGLVALLQRSPATLGRRELGSPATVQQVYRRVPVAITELLQIEVEAVAADELRGELEQLFQRGAAERLHYNADFDLEFVPHPIPYHLGHNSNQVVAGWLQRLGCEVERRPVLSGWRLVR